MLKQGFWLKLCLFFLFSGNLNAQNPEFTRLSNGLDLVVIRDTTLALTTLSLAVKGGAARENSESNGISHLLSRLVVQPSQSLSRMETGSAYLLRHEPGGHHLRLSLHLPADKTEGFLQFFAQRCRFLSLDKGSLAAEKKEIFQEIERYERDPLYLFSRQFAEEFWGNTWYSKDLRGSVLSLSKLSVSQLENQFLSDFHPDYSLLIVQGPHDLQQVKTWAEVSFGNWPAIGAPLQGEGNPAPPITHDRSVFTVNINELASEPQVLLGWQMPGVEVGGKVEGPALCRLINLRLSPLYEALVDQGPFHHLEANFFPGSSTSAILLSLQPKKDSLKNCLNRLEKELSQLEDPGYYTWEWREVATRHGLWDKALLKEDRDAWHRSIAEHWSLSDMESLLDHYEKDEKLPEPEALAHFASGFLENGYQGALLINSEQYRRYDAQALETQEVLVEVEPEDTVPTYSWSEDSPLLAIEYLRIWFAESSFEPADTCQATLVQAARLMREFPNDTFFVNGYTDSQGDGVTNYKLSIDRAASIKEILIDRYGIESGRLVVRGYGEAFPEYEESSPETRALNRRVKFQIKRGEDLYEP